MKQEYRYTIPPHEIKIKEIWDEKCERLELENTQLKDKIIELEKEIEKCENIIECLASDIENLEWQRNQFEYEVDRLRESRDCY